MTKRSSLEYYPWLGIPWAIYELLVGQVGNSVCITLWVLGIYVFARFTLHTEFAIRVKSADDRASFKWRYELLIILPIILITAASASITGLLKLW